jgi:ribose 5-phosphate isomerase B
VRLALGSDHAGFELKEHLRHWLEAQGYTVSDFGTYSPESTDYPDYAHAVAREVSAGAADRGILVCGTGVGMAIAANKIAGVRAAAINNTYLADLARRHNDANVLALGAREVALPLAEAITKTFLTTAYEGGRHQRRIDKIRQLEPAE